MGLTAVPDYEAVVLGAGVSGMVAASILLRQGRGPILIIDEYGHVGGNHIDISYPPYTFDVGSLIFQDDSPLLDHFPEILSRYQTVEPTWSRLNPQGVVTHYPFSVEDDVLAAGPVEVARMAASAITGRLIGRRRCRNAEDLINAHLGRRFATRSGLHSYMERLFGRPAAFIDIEFAENRLQWMISQARPLELVRRVARTTRGEPEASGTNKQLVRPRAGFTHLYEPAVDRLRAGGATFRLGTEVSSIEQDRESFTVRMGTSSVSAHRIISTIPIHRSLAMCGLTSPNPPLPTVTLSSLFFSFIGDRGFTTPILYNFTPHGDWKRLTVHSDFYGRAEGREFFTVEVVGHERDVPTHILDKEFRAHSQQNGLLAGDLRLEGSHVLENAYPIYTQGSGSHARAAVSMLSGFGVESLGRQGSFRYQPTARVSTIEAEAALPDDDQSLPPQAGFRTTESDI